MNHFIVVTGYANHPLKVDRVNELAKKLKSKNSDYILCYSTHYPPDKSFYENYEMVLYNDENPILNWDINDKITQTFGTSLLLTKDLVLRYPQPYHGYAHHLCICDGISLGLSTGFSYVSVMNFDVVDYCIDSLPDHLKLLQKGISSFYQWDEKGISTEFFSMNRDFAQFFHSYRNYSSYKKYNTVLYEYVMKNIYLNYTFRKDAITPNLSKNPCEGNVFGDLHFDDIQDEIKLESKFFIPYYNHRDDHEYQYDFFIPFLDGNDRFLYKTNSDIITCKIDNKPLEKTIFSENEKFSLTKLSNDCNMKIYKNSELIKDIRLHDRRQFGFIHKT